MQKDGIAFAALADQEYPERVIFMVLKKLSAEFAVKFEAGQFSKLESKRAVMQRTRT